MRVLTYIYIVVIIALLFFQHKFVSLHLSTGLPNLTALLIVSALLFLSNDMFALTSKLHSSFKPTFSDASQVQETLHVLILIVFIVYMYMFSMPSHVKINDLQHINYDQSRHTQFLIQEYLKAFDILFDEKRKKETKFKDFTKEDILHQIQVQIIKDFENNQKKCPKDYPFLGIFGDELNTFCFKDEARRNSNHLAASNNLISKFFPTHKYTKVCLKDNYNTWRNICYLEKDKESVKNYFAGETKEYDIPICKS